MNGSPPDKEELERYIQIIEGIPFLLTSPRARWRHSVSLFHLSGEGLFNGFIKSSLKLQYLINVKHRLTNLSEIHYEQYQRK